MWVGWNVLLSLLFIGIQDGPGVSFLAAFAAAPAVFSPCQDRLSQTTNYFAEEGVFPGSPSDLPAAIPLMSAYRMMVLQM